MPVRDGRGKGATTLPGPFSQVLIECVGEGDVRIPYSRVTEPSGSIN